MVVDDSIATIVSNMADSSLVLSAQQQAVDLSAVVSQAFDKAIAGGKAGALAGAAQVMSLMWLRYTSLTLDIHLVCATFNLLLFMHTELQ